MQSILEMLYHGVLVPNEESICRDPEYRLLSQKIITSLENWKSRLSEQEYEDLEALEDLFHQTQSMDMAASFTYGFRIGAALMVEVLSVEERMG